MDKIESRSQSRIFEETEGDQWFIRNLSHLNNKTTFYEVEVIKRMLGTYKTSINKVLEIGCGYGVKLLDICRFFDAEGVGIDPSSAAILRAYAITR